MNIFERIFSAPIWKRNYESACERADRYKALAESWEQAFLKQKAIAESWERMYQLEKRYNRG